MTINLAPAELPKDGTSFDLAIAVAILVVSGQLRQTEVDDSLFAGELALDGKLRGVRGGLNLAELAARHGYKRLFLPTQNVAQALLVTGIDIIGVGTLQALFLHLKGVTSLAPYRPRPRSLPRSSHPSSLLIDEIQGHDQAKRALIIAAAGHHNLLMSGPPGVGKTMLARALAQLLPPLSLEEQIEVTKLYSLAKEVDTQIVTVRPFRMPHHTTSPTALIGGGNRPRPGEISLAHRGVLFLDELLEFPRATLEVLRQPLEDKQVSLSRTHGHLTFPADFVLVAATNPCPCGYFGDSTHECTCTAATISRYQKRLSGPLLDRIDLQLTISRASPFEQDTMQITQHSKVLANINSVQKIQKARYISSMIYNGNVSDSLVKATFRASQGAHELLHKAAESLGLSMLARGKILRVARTIADLADSATVETEHIAEALQFRGNTGTGL